MSNKISMDKKYRTRSGIAIRRILCIDRASSVYPVVAETVEGRILHLDEWGNATVVGDEILEVSPYEDFKIDDKVMWSNNEKFWDRAHFAGVNSEGEATIWRNGATSWRSSDANVHPVRYCRKPTAEELAK